MGGGVSPRARGWTAPGIDTPHRTKPNWSDRAQERPMITREQNELLTRIDGDAPMGQLMRANYWIPFALSSHLAHGEAPMPVRLFGENYVAFRAENGRIGFFDERCPHRR